MNLMWAPWRKAYLRSNPGKRSGCLFCSLMKEKKDKKNLILFRSLHYVVILNRFPYNNGHLMVVPKRHIACLSRLNIQEKKEFFDVLEQVQQALQKAMKPQGFNLGMNIADVAGAGIPDHLHWHIVPRWKGDVNFMPVLADTKVISESLESAYEVLRNVLYPKKVFKPKN
ncbi:MAG TPA: HIT domain-containing protein [Candidatus Omnitrophota bacterium]|nr:HIT domain-containing protein [Candidatus Omnitrophota bacterium]